MFTSSLFLRFKNFILNLIQNSKTAEFIRDSLIFRHLDSLSWIFFILTILSTAFLTSGMIGGFALCFSFLNIFKMLFKKGETFKISYLDVILIIYFLFIFVSLMGSTLFLLSFKGFLKSVIYFVFYFTSVYFFLNNRGKILPTFAIIAALMSYESIVAIFQHFNRVEALAGWVDTSKMTNENELISRSFGTLKPSNPNLLGGYLTAGLSAVLAGVLLSFFRNKKAQALVFAGLFILNLVAIIFTGCRGAYIGMIGFFALLFWGVSYYVKEFLGGFSKVKKVYKNVALCLLGLGVAAIALTPSISRRFVSIFHFRGDSSISFRMNVYEAAFNMFKDNPFLGVGLGNLNFREIYGLYMKTGFDALGAYCVPLEVAVESGVFALLAFVSFIGFALYKGIKFIKARGSALLTKIIIFTTVLTIVATMAHGLFDTVWYRPQVQIIFWINVAILNSFIINKYNCKIQKN